MKSALSQLNRIVLQITPGQPLTDQQLLSLTDWTGLSDRYRGYPLVEGARQLIRRIINTGILRTRDRQQLIEAIEEYLTSATPADTPAAMAVEQPLHALHEAGLALREPNSST